MHPGLSGFHPLGEGADALVARVAMARAAQRTLDVQYYNFQADDIGAALLEELLNAADRGVRVRLLLDDLHTGRDDLLAAVGSHPNLEVRLFNPFVHRGARWIDFISDFSRVNRRMHNKSMTADSQVSVVGGRNIGNEYFGAGSEMEFNDFDVIAIGPVVPAISAEFDKYWNSEVVYQLAPLKIGNPKSAAELPEIRRKLEAQLEALRNTPYSAVLKETDLARSIERGDVALYWGAGELIADEPNKVMLSPTDASTHAMPKVRAILDQTQQELILISPYFVPGKAGMSWLQGLTQRGVHVIVLTNSYAATDVTMVHSAYATYRVALLRAGIELHELKPSIGVAGARLHERQSKESPRSSLHAKTYLADVHTIFVGSMNLDPRSARLNTEMGVMIDSATFATDLRSRLMARLPQIAYRVVLDTTADSKGNLVWISQEHGAEVRLEAEPGLGFSATMGQMLQRLLPIEDQL